MILLAFLREQVGKDDFTGRKSGQYLSPSSIDGKGHLMNNSLIFEPVLTPDSSMLRKTVLLFYGVGCEPS